MKNERGTKRIPVSHDTLLVSPFITTQWFVLIDGLRCRTDKGCQGFQVPVQGDAWLATCGGIKRGPKNGYATAPPDLRCVGGGFTATLCLHPSGPGSSPLNLWPPALNI